jgi:prepilin-type N-terminal cleavage/methylation domain-containing protein
MIDAKDKKDAGFTLIELLIVVAIISIIAALAVPQLLRNKMVANEVAAVTSLSAINKAQTLYALACGGGQFATSLAILGQPSPGTSDPFLPVPELIGATPQKAGYNFAMGAAADSVPGQADCNGNPTQTHYIATAVPMDFGSTGSKSYTMNDKGNTWQLYAATPPTEPLGPPAEPAK